MGIVDSRLLRADELGVRLEIVAGLPLWEPWPKFYQAQGVKDVVVFNPYTLEVRHIRKDRHTSHLSPVDINFECGYRCTV